MLLLKKRYCLCYTEIMTKKPTRKKPAYKQKNMIIGVVFLVSAIIIATVWGVLNTRKDTPKSTYFSYAAADTASLKDHKATGEISLDDVYQWDQTYFRLVSNQKLNDVEASRVYAYLAVAEADFAALSFNTTGKFAGNINPIAHDVACEFFASECASLTIDGASDDEFSKQASQLIMARIKARITEDAQMTKPYPLSADKNLWQGPDPKTGIDAGSRKPWHLTAGNQFRAPAPSAITSNDYVTLLAEVKQALGNITEPQRQAVVFWAGGPGTKTPPGIWLNIADQYMKDQASKLEAVLNARSDTATAMADAVIAVFDSKYTYQQKRPNMLDTSIITVMPTPNHPSYPAGHATISAAAFTVLTHYFPEHETTWKQQADEASTSRLWGGIHFSIDNKAGFTLGQKVGDQAITTK
jgi:hypothetical protein